MRRCCAVNPEGDSDAHSGFGDFDDRHDFTTAPTLAHTYSPDYPVCRQAYDIGADYIECGYTSPAQCALSASGRAAQCIINPYFANAQVPREPHYRPHPRIY
jgi:hypothetical protein